MESKTSKRRVKAAQRRLKAWELRLTGLTIREIAEQLGSDNCTISQDIKLQHEIYQQHFRESAAEASNIDLERLDKLITTYWEQATTFNPEAAELVLKFLKQRGAIHGYVSAKAAPETSTEDKLAKQILDRLEKKDTTNGAQ